jgi:uracil-DNA glycosylase family 4
MTDEDKSVLSNFLTTAKGSLTGFRMPTEESGVNAQIPVFSSPAELNEYLQTCVSCPLCGSRKKTVSSEEPDAGQRILVLVVGDGPGDDEDNSGRPFAGKSGALLDKMLAAINLSRGANCYLTHIVKCRPHEGRDPTMDEIAACRMYLDAELSLVQPKAIMAFGRTTAQNLIGTSGEIETLRGKLFNFNGIPLMATYNPEDLLRDENLKRPAWEDLKQFRMELDKILAR